MLKPINMSLSKYETKVEVINEMRKRETTKTAKKDSISITQVQNYVDFVDKFLTTPAYKESLKSEKNTTIFDPKTKEGDSFWLLFRKKDGKSVRKDGIVIVLAGKFYNIDKTKLLSLNKRLKALLPQK